MRSRVNESIKPPVLDPGDKGLELGVIDAQNAQADRKNAKKSIGGRLYKKVSLENVVHVRHL